MPTTIDGNTGASAVQDSTVGPTKLTQPMTLMTAVSTTSGTSIDFTGIPSWVKKITVMLDGLSTNGASNILLQVGTSGGVEATGYSSSAQTNTTVGLATTGFALTASIASTSVSSGMFILGNLTGNTWVLQGVMGYSNAAGVAMAGGSKTLSGVLTRLRLTTVNGTDTFDAGTMNVMYEG